MANDPFRFSFIALATGLALGGCGGSDSANSGGFPSGQTCNDAGVCTSNSNGANGGYGAFNFGGSGNNGTGNSTNYGGTGNSVNGGTGGPPPGPNCGNGTIDPGEDCDQGNLAGRNCAAATMGAMPNGILTCQTNCLFNVSQCTSSGTGIGTGGGTGTGGATGTGGRRGTGGGP